MVLDLDVERKLRLAGLDHLIRRVRELDREIDSVAMAMLDRLVAIKAQHAQCRVLPDSPVACHYTTLGLSCDASFDEIRTQYRRLAKKYHPDRGGDTRRMQAITEAYRAITTYQTSSRPLA